MKGKGNRTLHRSSSVHRTSDEHGRSAQQEPDQMPPVTFAHVFGDAPILRQKHYEAPSAFTPENLLREARRQKGLPAGSVPAICVFDPDGDLVDSLHATGCTHRHPTWACYHTILDTFMHDEIEYGIIGRVVGAPFAVLVAEELFASGCQLLISITSAGQILSMGRPPYVVLIEHALRDEGTSYHYLPPAPYSHLAPALREMLCIAWDHTRVPLAIGSSWTTDAPFRETEAMIAMCRKEGILAVEMEAAALYALAQARKYQIICFAHVTNQMGQSEGDFEKGDASGSATALYVVGQTARSWRQRQGRSLAFM
jgi:uridine phosphorylase